jgi:hypothetical protein
MKRFRKRTENKNKGQGAIEYLLILGAAILVVAIVVVAVTNIIQQGQSQTSSSTSSQQKAVNDLWKLKAGTLIFSDYAYSGSDYTKTIVFGSETNCTIRQALQSMNKVLNTNEIYLGGNNTNYCGIYRDGTNADSGSINCNDKIIIGKDYNIQVFLTAGPPAQVMPASTIIWKAWCD